MLYPSFQLQGRPEKGVWLYSSHTLKEEPILATSGRSQCREGVLEAQGVASILNGSPDCRI